MGNIESGKQMIQQAGGILEALSAFRADRDAGCEILLAYIAEYDAGEAGRLAAALNK